MVRGIRSPWVCSRKMMNWPALPLPGDPRRLDREPLDIGREPLGLDDRKHQAHLDNMSRLRDKNHARVVP